MTGSDAQEVPKELRGAVEDHDHQDAATKGEEVDDGKPKEFRGAEEKVPETASGNW